MVPRCSALSANVQREGDDIREERPDGFLSGRAHLGSAVAEGRDDVVRTRELIDRVVDALRREPEIVGQATLCDTRDELASSGVHERLA
jgi:hypothetical protein